MKFQRNQSLPLSQQPDPSIRRRLSSLNLNLKSVTDYSSPATQWALGRSKSVSAMGENAGNSIAKWWGWSWDWILSRKPAFAVDLEMSSEETAAIGCQNRGSWRHVFFKVSSEIKRIVGGGSDKPKFSATYFKNFDNRKNTLPH